MTAPHPTARRLLAVVSAVAAAALLAGCAERPQDLGNGGRRHGVTSYAAQPGAFHARDWSGGDRAAWQAQLNQRAQGQNEYLRFSAAGGLIAGALQTRMFEPGPIVAAAPGALTPMVAASAAPAAASRP